MWIEDDGSLKGRTFAISDIHGCLKQFKSLVKNLGLGVNDTLILMGDYIDRGEDSAGVLDYIIELKEVFNVVTLLGNHDAMLRDTLYNSNQSKREKWGSIWMNNGGMQTLRSYGCGVEVIDSPEYIPKKLQEHWWMIREMPLYFITDTHIFVHSTPRSDLAIEDHSEEELIWRRPSIEDRNGFYKHISGKVVISGHTAQEGRPLMLSDHNILIDTGCFFTGVLTAIEICDTMHPTHDFIFHRVDGEDL